MSFGSPHRHYRLTDSTNARARELVEADAPHGTVVTADEQTAGRGRQGRAWTAPTGKGLLYSAILRPLDERHLLLPLSVPLAVCAAAEALRPGIECQVKWPNDVWLDERKLAGILIEAKMPGQDSADGWAVIGVGLNLTVAPDEFPAELKWPAVSLYQDAPSVVAPMDAQRGAHLRDEARCALDVALERWTTAPRDEVLGAWRSRDALRGRKVSWDGGAGTAEGIDDSGDLLVRRLDGDLVALGAGEVHLRL